MVFVKANLEEEEEKKRLGMEEGRILRGHYLESRSFTPRPLGGFSCEHVCDPYLNQLYDVRVVHQLHYLNFSKQSGKVFLVQLVLIYYLHCNLGI